MLQKISKPGKGPLAGTRAFVIAPGPSLTNEVVDSLVPFWLAGDVGFFVINDAYRMIPAADILYACDASWWEHWGGAPDFWGQRWSSHSSDNPKLELAKRYCLNLIEGRHGATFSIETDRICYGQNSGFQAVNLAILFGMTEIILVGFDMRKVDGKSHFFGDHPRHLAQTLTYQPFISAFERAALDLPPGVQILNATPGSALTCFPMVRLEDVVSSAAA